MSSHWSNDDHKEILHINASNKITEMKTETKVTTVEALKIYTNTYT